MNRKIQFKSDETILFIGDSITDCDSRENHYAPLGCGYVNFAGNLLVAKYPQLNLKILNRGTNGDTTRTLKWRWERDCIQENPDVLSILIGINYICWAHNEDPAGQAKAVALNEYKSNYHSILQAARDNCQCRFVLMEPFLFCDDPENPMYRCLTRYIEVVHKLADEFEAPVVPLQEEFENLKYSVPAHKWAQDMVHPYPWAHAWIAHQWLSIVAD